MRITMKPVIRLSDLCEALNAQYGGNSTPIDLANLLFDIEWEFGGYEELRWKWLEGESDERLQCIYAFFEDCMNGYDSYLILMDA